MTDDYLDSRVKLSSDRLDALRQRVESGVHGVQLDGLTIFAAGSFARLEASEHSDIDLFFTYHPSGSTLKHRRTNELKLFGRLIDLVEELGFPPFSGDSRFLQTHDIDQMLIHLGAPEDDAANFFTLRMLMLLESKCVYGRDAYESSLRAVVDAYYRDFNGNEATFEPWFLINDVMRYWKTLLLNYESRRNYLNPEERSEARAKNFKLRYSRMTTCFATVAALASFDSTPSRDDVFELALLTPHDRLQLVYDRVVVARPIIEELLSDYTWFLQQTSLSKEDLHAKMENDDERRTMFAHAEEYGAKMFDLLVKIDTARGTSPKLVRHLVI